MPPFEKAELLFLKTSSFSKDDDFKASALTVGEEHEVLRLFEGKVDEAEGMSMRLHEEIRSLVLKAGKVNMEIKASGAKTMARVSEESIRSIVLSTMDQVSTLLGSDENMKPVLRAVLSDSVSRSSNSIEKLSDLALGSVGGKFDSSLQRLFQGQDIGKLKPTISPLATVPSFELLAGESDHTFRATSPESLPLRVTVTPYVFVEAGQLLRLDEDTDTSTKYKVEIGSCTHVELFKSSITGSVGEARVQIHVTPTQQNSTNVCVFGERKDMPRLRVVDVRACQTNATPRAKQTRLDICSSSTFGSKSLTLMVKMRTRPNEEAAAMDVQLVLEPAWLRDSR